MPSCGYFMDFVMNHTMILFRNDDNGKIIIDNANAGHENDKDKCEPQPATDSKGLVVPDMSVVMEQDDISECVDQ